MQAIVPFLLSAVALSLVAGGAHAQFAQAPSLGSLLQPEVVTPPPAVRGPALGSVSTRVTANGQIFQRAGAGVDAPGAQRADVGSVRGLRGAATVTTDATLLGDIRQEQGRALSQSVGIASVDGVDGAGVIQTSAIVSGDIDQDSLAAGAQSLLVGSVQDGAPTSATTRAVLSGNVGQSAEVGGLAATLQSISIAAVEGSTGRASTDTVVGAGLSQSAFGSGAAKRQVMSLGSVADSSGDARTRVQVEGAVTQFLSSARGGDQQIHIGSVRGVQGLTVRTDVAVNGAVNQVNSGAQSAQSILLGAVVAE